MPGMYILGYVVDSSLSLLELPGFRNEDRELRFRCALQIRLRNLGIVCEVKI